MTVIYSIKHTHNMLTEVYMTEDFLWNKFAETGRISDYLLYSAQRDILYDDNRGDSP